MRRVTILPTKVEKGNTMKSPDEEKKSEVKEEETTSNITETEDGGVEVSVEDESTEETVVQEQKEEAKVEKKTEHKQDPLTNKVYAHDRILTNVQKSIEELKTIMLASSPSSTITQEQEAKLDDIDKLAQKDWKAAVNQLAEAKFQELKKQEKEQLDKEQSNLQIAQLIEQNSQTVLKTHPELEESDSEKSQIFQSILNNNPRWRTSPDGPLLTMYEMEKELRKRGYDVDGSITRTAENATQRVVKTVSASLPTSRTITNNSNKIVLSREQKEFCDQNGISYEDYARTLRKSGEKEGVSV